MTRRLALVLLFCLTVFGCEGDYTIYDVHPPEVVYVDVPVEVLVDGKSIKKDAKVVEMKFHPKSYYKESKMNLKSLVKETIKEVVTERKLQMFFEKNVPTNPSKWSYYKSQAKKKFDVYPSAYANGWAAKQYKAAGGGWKKG